MTDKKEVNAHELSNVAYLRLLNRMVVDKTFAVVLNQDTYLVNENMSVSLLGGINPSHEKLIKFKTWLIMKYNNPAV